jgi:hypothetical protein
MDLKLIELVGGWVFKLLGLNADRKLAVAKYLEHIADTISKFGPRLRGDAQHDELVGYICEIQNYAKKFNEATSHVLSEKDRNEFVAKLNQAFNAKSLLAVKNGTDKEALLDQLATIAGCFRAASATLMASAGKVG